MPADPIYSLATAAKAIGTLWAAYQAYKLASFLHLHFIRRSTLKRYLKTSPSGEPAWALVTGSTDGIGRGFAEELCEHGFNIILHGRNPEKLEIEKQKLLARWPKRLIQTLCIDATAETGNAQRLEQAAIDLKALNIRVLINNVGGTGGMPAFCPLHDRTSEEARIFIDMNLRFPTEITRVLLPQLRHNTPSLILNVSSATADFGLPYLSVYSGAKAYNRSWSRCLTSEMKADNLDVEVMALVVSAVATDNYAKPQGLFVPNARKFAKAALGVVGCGRSVVYPYWGHRVQSFMFDVMPTRMAESMIVDVGRKEKADEEKLKGKRE
ncbi:Putative short-chain dehydrogenase/reductase SDR, NAD(P)-binding domain superfamily [Septoria linicola]|uniref:Short-chain dehydrogenase/reductase SDR, NAD(P)-binding domain superfamily n=1 Tax=Septoria linicola TaxID=215465 RepID=A0A9Q9ALQ2_9PEZI|nr:putative short-chain dehydrogenase/reductase SDR, NAD(P)-binding domain superfamily [Septoria linicola]USW48312.1 Putative short-chain dehydrogenase/reductase SDR, NAD(P)-binding domain superfamily [Septoria linicola]